MNDAKFIVVQDQNIASVLMSAGFKVVSCVNNVYTFMNVVPKNFQFANIDVKKLVYTNMLTF